MLVCVICEMCPNEYTVFCKCDMQSRTPLKVTIKIEIK